MKSTERSKNLKQSLVGTDSYILTHTSYQGKDRVKIDLSSWRDKPYEGKIVELSPSLTDNVTDYYDLILGASEIHCIPSSMHCLVDSIYDEVLGKMFIHDIRIDTKMHFNNKWNNGCWVWVRYDEKE